MADALLEALARAAEGEFGSRYGRPARWLVAAPGRVNLIGEHTDYNDGFVLPVAIDREISLAHVGTDDRRVEIESAASGDVASFDLDDLDPSRRSGAWIDYVAGTAWALIDAGVPVRGFRGLLTSDLPAGAGLSSSAALELASALALTDGVAPDVERLTIARLAQRGENEYVGVNCGLMDQYASAFGIEDHALLLDCRAVRHRPIPLPIAEVALVVCHTGSARRLEASGYNERRSQCAAAVAAIAMHDATVHSLRDVTPAVLDDLRNDIDPIAFARAKHVVNENDRVLATVAALERDDLGEVGRLFAASHASMRDLFDISSPELDALVEIANGAPGVIGARLTGGGFGGCTVNLVHRDAVAGFRETILAEYPARSGLTPRVFEVEAAAVARIFDA